MVMSTVKKVTDFGEKPGPITILFSCAKVLMETEIGIIIGQVCFIQAVLRLHRLLNTMV